MAGELIRVKTGIPVILCSGYSARASQEQALVMGIRAFVPKPILHSEIAATIRKILEKK